MRPTIHINIGVLFNIHSFVHSFIHLILHEWYSTKCCTVPAHLHLCFWTDYRKSPPSWCVQLPFVLLDLCKFKMLHHRQQPYCFTPWSFSVNHTWKVPITLQRRAATTVTAASPLTEGALVMVSAPLQALC